MKKQKIKMKNKKQSSSRLLLDKHEAISEHSLFFKLTRYYKVRYYYFGE